MTTTIKNPYIKFIGHNSEDVTGSCNLIRFMNYTILVDCGAVQSNDDKADYIANNKLHKDIKPKALSGIVLTHQHL